KGMWRGDAGRSYVEKIENRWQYVKRHRRHGCHGSTFNLSRPACDCWDAVSSLVKLPLLPAEWPVRTHFRPNSLIIMQIAAIVGSKKYERLLVDTLFFQRFQNAAHALIKPLYHLVYYFSDFVRFMRPEFAPGSRLRTGVVAAFSPRFELIILGCLPGKMNGIVRHIQKEGFGFVPLNELNCIARDDVGRVSFLENQFVVMPPVTVAIAIHLCKVVA